MSFSEYLRIPTAVELVSHDKESALAELNQALCRALRLRRPKPILEELLKREEASSTFIGQGIAIPQARGPIRAPFALAVGRSVQGISFDAARGALAHLIVLVIVKESETDSGRQIAFLSEIASCFKSDTVRDAVLSSPAPVDIASIISSFDSQAGSPAPTSATRRAPDPVISAAVSLSREIKANALLLFADSVRENDFIDKLPVRQKKIVVVSNKTRFSADDKRIAALIQAPSFRSDRISQLKIGLLLALSRGLLKREDKVVCISGNSRNGVFDTIISIDVDREYEFFFTASRSVLPPDVEPEVLERVVGIAGEIAVEGREGKSTGTIFVVGDTNSVSAYVRQLIINPFRGYSETERNIMDPGLDETIKEFAAIDGAFVITGDGVVLSAGSYLKPQAEIEPLPSGLGARHVAAAAITACTNALAVAVSESTGTVTLFKNGAILMSLSKPISQAASPAPKLL